MGIFPNEIKLFTQQAWTVVGKLLRFLSLVRISIFLKSCINIITYNNIKVLVQDIAFYI